MGNLLLWVSGCYFVPKASGPLRAIKHEWAPGQQQDRLIVFLPGRSDKPEDFVERGLWAELKKRDMPFDAVAVDAHLGYYLKMTVVDRLMEEVIRPARTSGYSEIWVVGASLGGLGALLVEQMNPGTWQEMILLAPFLGDDKSLYREFESTGGVEHWEPRGEFGKTDFSPRLWMWLKDWPQEIVERPAVYLGYGDRDRLRLGIDHLVPLLPEENVVVESGGHKWSVWAELWASILKRIDE